MRTSPPNKNFYSPPQLKRPVPQISHSPPELLNSPPRSLNNQNDNRILNSTPISRSQSNLDTVFKSRQSKLDTEVTNDKNKNKTQLSQKYQIQRNYSNKDIPENLPKHNDNGIKHSASEVNLSNFKINRPVSRKNSFSKNRNATSIPNVSRIPSSVSNKNENHKNESSTLMKNEEYSTPVSTHFTKSSVDVETKPSLIKTPLDRPVGLDLEEFLPVSLLIVLIFIQ